LIKYLINLFTNFILNVIRELYYFIINIVDKIINFNIDNSEQQFYLIEEQKPNGYKNTYSSSLQIYK
jgi:hypothetical protein